jgi:DNA modification methylase
MADPAADRQPSADPIVAGERSTTRGQAHPANALNDLSGEEWLYFTKSIWSTAYPSELGHARRKAHGANKPPRLMCRLIEFFTKTGELVLDPFAGVGGTLLGAAIAQGPRRALGLELEPRWVEIYRAVLAELQAEREGRGPLLPEVGPSDPGGVREFDPSGLELRRADALEALPGLAEGSVDFVATDPPYNVQLPLTMAGGRLAETHANRRTDYAMVSDDPADLANAADYPTFLDRMETVLSECRRVLRPGRYAAVIVRDAYQDGRYVFTGADLAARADRVGLVPKGDLVWYQAGTRLRPYGYPNAFVPNIAHQHILVLRRER